MLSKHTSLLQDLKMKWNNIVDTSFLLSELFLSRFTQSRHSEVSTIQLMRSYEHSTCTEVSSSLALLQIIRHKCSAQDGPKRHSLPFLLEPGEKPQALKKNQMEP